MIVLSAGFCPTHISLPVKYTFQLFTYQSTCYALISALHCIVSIYSLMQSFSLYIWICFICFNHTQGIPILYKLLLWTYQQTHLSFPTLTYLLNSCSCCTIYQSLYYVHFHVYTHKYFCWIIEYICFSVLQKRY